MERLPSERALTTSRSCISVCTHHLVPAKVFMPVLAAAQVYSLKGPRSSEQQGRHRGSALTNCTLRSAHVVLSATAQLRRRLAQMAQFGARHRALSWLQNSCAVIVCLHMQVVHDAFFQVMGQVGSLSIQSEPVWRTTLSKYVAEH